MEKKLARSSIRVFAQGGTISLLGLLFGKIATFGLEIFLARFLGVSNYGIFSLSRTIVRIPNLTTDLGFPQGIIRFSSLYLEEKNHRLVKGLLVTAILVVLGSGFLASALLYIHIPTLAEWFSEPLLKEPLKVLVWLLAPSGLINVVAAYARAHHRIDYDVLFRIIFQPVSTLFLCLILSTVGLSLLGVTYIWLAVYFVNMVSSIFILRRTFWPDLKDYPMETRAGSWLRFSIPTVLLGMSTLLLRYSSRLLLGYFADSEAVGIFTAANSMAENLSVFVIALNPVFAPIIATFAAKGDKESLAHDMTLITRWLFTFTLPIILFVMLFAGEIMTLFGEEFAQASILLVILSIAQLVNSGTGPVGVALQMTGHQDIDFINGLVTFIANLLLGVWLIPLYGAVGAAIATTIALSALHLARTLEVYLILKILPYSAAFYKCLAAASVSMLAVWLIRDYLLTGLTTFLLVVVGAAIMFPIYMLTLLVLGFEEEDQKIWALIRQRIKF